MNAPHAAVISIALADGRHEAIAQAGDTLDVMQAVLPISQYSAQAEDVNSQRAFVNHYARPNPRQQIGLADHLARARDEREQNLPRATGNVYRMARVQQQTSVRNELEPAELIARCGAHQLLRARDWRDEAITMAA